jgi:hypothetical protein
VKQTSELDNKRTLEKLEIERRYWAAQGVDWRIVTEHEISRQKAKNIEWLYTSDGFVSDDCPAYVIAQAKTALLQVLQRSKSSVADASRMIESEFLLSAGTGLQLYKQLVLDREITVDLSNPINLCSREVAA